MTKKELPIVEIEATAGTQVRRFLDPNVIDDYAEALQTGAIFPPIVVFAEKGSQRFVLADGFHRVGAAKKAGLETIVCEIHEGKVHDALKFALSANDEHGLRRTNKDKRNAVELALKDPEWCAWNNVEISRLCRVSDFLVRKVREDLVLAGKIDEPETVKTTRGGKTVEQRASSARSIKSTSSNSSHNSGTSKKQTARRGPKTQDEIDREEIVTALGLINDKPYNGGVALDKLTLHDQTKQAKLAIEWLQEWVKAETKAA